MLKYVFHAEWDGTVGTTNPDAGGLSFHYRIEQSQEGGDAFMEKRPPDFGKFRQ